MVANAGIGFAADLLDSMFHTPCNKLQTLTPSVAFAVSLPVIRNVPFVVVRNATSS